MALTVGGALEPQAYRSKYNFGDIRDLIRALKDSNPGNRSWAIQNIAKKGIDAKEAFTMLIDALKDEDSTVRLSAASALATVAEEFKGCVVVEKLAYKAIPALFEFIRSEREQTETALFWAVKALTGLGSSNCPEFIEEVRKGSKT